MSTSRNVLILVAHLQPFLLANLRALLLYDVRIIVVHWPTPSDAPIIPAVAGNRISFLEKHTEKMTEIARAIDLFSPDIILAPGWMDRQYLQWCRTYRKRGVPVVMSMDNQWKGSLRQWINIVVGRLRLHRCYSHAFVPGARQVAYAQRLGFRQSRILEHFCTPDIELFRSFYQARKSARQEKVLLYAGRLVPHKLLHLLEAFTGIQEHELNGWKMNIIGSGPLETHQLMRAKHIVHYKHLPQEAMREAFASAGVFCLTSTDEPWGTTIQEAAIAGLPLLLSDACGAGDAFLAHSVNGLLCKPDTASIRTALLAVIHADAALLQAWGEASHEIAIESPGNDAWAEQLLRVSII